MARLRALIVIIYKLLQFEKKLVKAEIARNFSSKCSKLEVLIGCSLKPFYDLYFKA